jgi:hypothetical protein
MSQLYVPGPAQIFVGTGASGAYVFLGFSESDVRISLSAEFEDVNADYGGRVAVDSQYMGEQAFASFDIIRYSEAVYNALAARTASAGSITAGMAPGSIAAGSVTGAGIGTLMLAEGAAVPICIKSPYVVKSAFSGMNAGYTFGAAWLDGSVDHSLSARVKKPRMSMRCLPIWNVTAGTAILYTNTIPGSLPALS